LIFIVEEISDPIHHGVAVWSRMVKEVSPTGRLLHIQQPSA
jgi:hypothetical protein